ncbi:MAG: hypothetical protein RR458_05185 [Clostridia bacterium]
METKKNEIKVNETKNLTTYDNAKTNLSALISEEMEGLNIAFERIKIPGAGGLAYEMPSDIADSPDLEKEFKAVILYHHPIHSYYREKYAGGNNPPDCGSMDGRKGLVVESGEVKDCNECPFGKFGSGENGAKACKQKRRIYLLRENEALPTLLSLPTGSLTEFSKYVMRLLSKGKKTNGVVTKFSLKKAQNAGGISYSQAVFAVDRTLTENEQASVNKMSEQVKMLAGSVDVQQEE